MTDGTNVRDSGAKMLRFSNRTDLPTPRSRNARMDLSKLGDERAHHGAGSATVSEFERNRRSVAVGEHPPVPLPMSGDVRPD